MSSSELHRRESLITRSSQSLVQAIESRAHGDVLIAAPDDSQDRLDPILPGHQQTLAGPQWSLASDAEIYIDKLPNSRDEEPIPYDRAEFDTVINVFPKRDALERMVPFHEMMWVTKPGGTVLQATGILPKRDPDHDFKGWFSTTDCGTLEEVILTRHDDYKTPNVITHYTVSDSVRTPTPRQ